jgi:dGTPase
VSSADRAELERVFEKVIVFHAIDDVYRGTREQRSILQSQTAGLIGRYIKGIEIRVAKDTHEKWARIDTTLEKEIFMWKQLTWHYVILNPLLATQQYGQRRIIRDLFGIFQEAAIDEKSRTIFPPLIKEVLDECSTDNQRRTRAITDFICGLTEQEAISMHRRLTGISLGSALYSVLR